MSYVEDVSYDVTAEVSFTTSDTAFDEVHGAFECDNPDPPKECEHTYDVTYQASSGSTHTLRENGSYYDSIRFSPTVEVVRVLAGGSTIIDTVYSRGYLKNIGVIDTIEDGDYIYSEDTTEITGIDEDIAKTELRYTPETLSTTTTKWQARTFQDRWDFDQSHDDSLEVFRGHSYLSHYVTSVPGGATSATTITDIKIYNTLPNGAVNIDDDLHTVDANDPFVPPENKVIIPAPPAGVWDAFVGALEYGTVEVTNSAVELASSAKAKAHDEGLPDEFNEYLAWSVNPVGQMVENAVKGLVDIFTVDVPTVYANSRAGGYSRLDSAGNAVGTALATIVGVRGISDAFSEHDAVDAHRQSLGERAFDGVFGTIALVGTAVGLGGAAKSLSSGGAKVNPVKPRAGDPATAVAPNRLTGVIEQHHQLPREFAKRFKDAGLNIDDFIIPLDKAKHRLRPGGIHTNGGGNWNRVWREFLDANKNAEAPEILEQLAKMRKQFGLE
jgi:hypothetical protein